jgi:hypothetical protein
MASQKIDAVGEHIEKLETMLRARDMQILELTEQQHLTDLRIKQIQSAQVEFNAKQFERLAAAAENVLCANSSLAAPRALKHAHVQTEVHKHKHRHEHKHKRNSPDAHIPRPVPSVRSH